MNVLRYCFMLGAMVITYGLQIEFSSSPKEGMRVPITEQLILRCSLKDTRCPGNQSLAAQKSTTKKIKYVTSIKVTKNGNCLAHESLYDPARAFTIQSNLKVNGKVSKFSPNDSYAELVLTSPKETEAGSYICEINGVDEFSDNVVLTKVLQVDSLPKMSNHILTSIQDILQTMHRETGHKRCGGSQQWYSRKPNERYRRVNVKFSRAYDLPPKVVAGVSAKDIGANTNYRLSIRVISITKTDFTVECVTWADTIVYMVDFFWISSN